MPREGPNHFLFIRAQRQIFTRGMVRAECMYGKIHRWMAPHSDDVKKLKYFRPSIVLPSTVVMLKCMRVAFYWSGKMLSSILTRIFNLLSHVFSSLSLRFLPSTYIIIYIHRALLEVHAIPGPI